MPATRDILSMTAVDNKNFINEFEEHCNGNRTDTKTQFLTRLRQTFPSFHVTEVEQYSVSLSEFAHAGKAEIILDSGEEHFNATRKWKPVGDGIEKKLHTGKLEDEYRLARFQYIWEEKEFLVYYVQWKDMLESRERMYYVLHPRNESNINDGHCAETDELVLAAGKWTSQLHEEIFVFDDGRWEKSKDLWKSVNGSSWDDVILDPEMKKGIIEDVQGFFDNQEVYAQYSVPWKRGIILHGVPGNGKTVSIKALMSSLYSRGDNIPSLYVKSFDTKCQTEQYSIRQIFLAARKAAPCLLVFEDLDSLVRDDIRSYFLNEVDGLESNDGILMIGSTNHLDRLDPAISKRPSRFDRKYHFKLPGETERTLYASYWRKKLLANNTVDFPEELCNIIAKLTEGFSFAYLKELFVMALLGLVRGFKGDDFEIVDAEEAETADSEAGAKPTADGPAPSSDKKEVESCTCSKKCDKCGLPKEQEVKKAEEAAEKKEEVKKAKIAMPTVEVPEELADSLFLKVIKHQIRVLHDEMDNTKEDQWASGKKGFKGGDHGRAFQMANLQEAARRRRC